MIRGLVIRLIVLCGFFYLILTISYLMVKKATEVKPQYLVKKPQPVVGKEVIGDFEVRLKVPFAEHYVKLENLSLVFDDKKYKNLKDEIYQRRFQIRDLIDTILLDKGLEITTPEGKQKLKQQIKDKINEILINGKITDVYFRLIYQ